MKNVNFFSCAARLKAVRQDLAQMKTVRELLNYLPDVLLERAATLLLLVWVVSPVYMVARQLLLPPHEAFALDLARDLLATGWLTILQVVGNLGLILGLVAAGKRLCRRPWRQRHQPGYLIGVLLPVSLLLMFFWSLLSTLQAVDRTRAFWGDPYRREGFMTIVAYLGILACACLVKSRVRARRLLAAFSLSSLVVSIHYLAYWRPELYGTNYAGIFLQFNHTAYYFCLAILTSLTLLLTVNETRTYEKGLWLLTFSAATLALLANNSFGPYLASGGGLLLAVFFRPKSALRSQNISLISALLIYVGLSIAFNLLHSGFQRDASLLANDVANIAQRNGQADMAGSGRWLLWKTGLKSATERPWFGFGPDCLGQHFIDQGVTYNDRPHNEFIYFAASLGIPALFFYVTGLAAHLRNFLRVWKRLDWHVIGLFCTVGAYLISSLFGNTMFYTTPFFILFLGLSYSQLRYAAEP